MKHWCSPSEEDLRKSLGDCVTIEIEEMIYSLEIRNKIFMLLDLGLS